MTRILDMERASGHGTPVYVTVWDLTPASVWASAARGMGLGIFHTNVWLPDLSVEWAFGGHGYRDVSGVFSLPRDPVVLDAVHQRVSATAHPDPLLAEKPNTLDGLSWLGPEQIPAPGAPPLPAARYMGAYFIGYAGNASSEQASEQPWIAAQTGKMAFREPDALVEPYFVRAAAVLAQAAEKSRVQGDTSSSDDRSSAGKRHPRHRGARLASIAHVQATMQQLRKDPEWMGPTYDLVAHNCNHFADMVCTRLTGARLPAWINRTASFGSNLLWAIPKSILDIDTRIPLEDSDLVPDPDDSIDSTLDADHHKDTTR